MRRGLTSRKVFGEPSKRYDHARHSPRVAGTLAFEKRDLFPPVRTCARRRVVKASGVASFRPLTHSAHKTACLPSVRRVVHGFVRVPVRERMVMVPAACQTTTVLP